MTLADHNDEFEGRRNKVGGQQKSSPSKILPEVLDSMGNNPYITYPQIMTILAKINPNIYYYPRGFQWLVFGVMSS